MTIDDSSSSDSSSSRQTKKRKVEAAPYTLQDLIELLITYVTQKEPSRIALNGRDDGPLLNLPNEILSVIFSHLGLSDITIVRTLCRRACRLIDDDPNVIEWQDARWKYFYRSTGRSYRRKRLCSTDGAPLIFALQRPAMMRHKLLMVSADRRSAHIIDVIDRICQELNLSFAICFDKDSVSSIPLSHLSRVKHVCFEERQWSPDCWHRDMLPKNLRELYIQYQESSNIEHLPLHLASLEVDCSELLSVPNMTMYRQLTTISFSDIEWPHDFVLDCNLLPKSLQEFAIEDCVIGNCEVLENLEKLDLYAMRHPLPLLFPPCLQKLTLCGTEVNDSLAMMTFPVSLVRLALHSNSSFEVCDLSYLINLSDFCLSADDDLSTTVECLPPNLLHLEIGDLKMTHFNFSKLAKLRSLNLRVLSNGSFLYPDSLEELHLYLGGTALPDGHVFPDTLRDLRIDYDATRL